MSYFKLNSIIIYSTECEQIWRKAVVAVHQVILLPIQTIITLNNIEIETKVSDTRMEANGPIVQSVIAAKENDNSL